MTETHSAPESLERSLELTERLSAEMASLSRLSDGFGRSLTSALQSAIVQGKGLDQVLKQIVLRLSDRALSTALAPLGRMFDGLLGGLVKGIGFAGFAKGGVFENGAVRRFANGGVVASPTSFPMAGGGLGLMGEAGPEAILPLARGSDGRLGVRTQGDQGSTIRVEFNVTTPDASSFTRSEAQVTAMLARAVGRGRRGL